MSLRMLRKTPLASAVVSLAILLSGCASSSFIKPMELPESKQGSATAAAETAREDWVDPAVTKSGKPSVVLVTPMGVPESIRAKKISLKLAPGATLSDVVATLGEEGYSIILANPDTANKTFYLPHYSGTIGGLMSAISRATDVWFTWNDGTIVVDAKERVTFTVPQEGGFAEVFAKGLRALGVEDSAVAWEAGMATVNLAPSQLKRIHKYVERMTSNAAIITLQVAVVNVNLDQSAKEGVDWASMSLAVGRGAGQYPAALFQKANTTGVSPVLNSTNTTGTGATGVTGAVGTTGAATATAAVVEAASSLLLTGTSVKGLVVAGDKFSLGGLINFLHTYGVAETKQHAKLTTSAGKKVELKSLTQIPYVENIGATTATNTQAISGSATTAKADDGIEVSLTPTYDAAGNTVTVDLSLAIKAVLAFNELQAGNQLGKLTQPTTATRSFSDTVRLRPGQTAVVGGLTYDSVSDNRGLPSFMTVGTRLESQTLKVTRQTMFVVIRPTVEILGGLEERDDSSQDYVPAAMLTPDPSPDSAGAKTPAKKKAQPAAREGTAASSPASPKHKANQPAASSPDAAGVDPDAQAAARARLAERESVRSEAPVPSAPSAPSVSSAAPATSGTSAAPASLSPSAPTASAAPVTPAVPTAVPAAPASLVPPAAPSAPQAAVPSAGAVSRPKPAAVPEGVSSADYEPLDADPSITEQKAAGKQ